MKALWIQDNNGVYMDRVPLVISIGRHRAVLHGPALSEPSGQLALQQIVTKILNALNEQEQEAA